MSLFLKEVRENSNIEQNDRTEQYGNSNYSNIYLLNIIFTLCCGNIQLISFSLKKKKNYFIQFTFYM